MAVIRRPYDKVIPQLYATPGGGTPMTKQSFKEECDINGILARFAKTGTVTHVNDYQGQYGDFTHIPDDYHGALIQMQAAQDMFMSLPAEIRASFDNDAATFLEFADDPENEAEMRELGLLPPAEQNAAEPAAPAPKQETAAPKSTAEGSEAE